jgi:general secretion pathway protein G
MEKTIPLDPWGHAYIYVYPGTHNPNGYDLSAIAPDGQVFGNWVQ